MYSHRPPHPGREERTSARILTAPWKTLALAERAAALVLARDAGAQAAGGPVDPADLEAPRPFEYYIHVLTPLIGRELVGAKTASGWKLQCLDHRALEDPRVQAFLFGWQERALVVLSELSDHPEAPADPGRAGTADILRVLEGASEGEKPEERGTG
jgi:hypothetical protein